MGASTEVENNSGEKPADLIDPDYKELAKLFETGSVWRDTKWTQETTEITSVDPQRSNVKRQSKLQNKGAFLSLILESKKSPFYFKKWDSDFYKFIFK